MNINDMTIGEFKELSKLFATNQSTSKDESYDPFIGQYVIVRTYSAGVFSGTLKARYGNKIVLENSRRLWKWHAKEGISLSEVSQKGVIAAECKFCCIEPLKLIEDIEITPCSDEAKKAIQGVPDYVIK